MSNPLISPDTPLRNDLDMSPGTWQQVLDSFYGKTPIVVESPEKVIGVIETRPGLVPETIDKDAYREFMRGL